MSRRFVLVKSYYGLGGDLCVMLGAMQLAAERGRALVVDWSGGRYGSVDDGNLFARFFAEPRVLKPADLPPTDSMTVYPDVWAGRAHLPPVTYLADIDLTQSRPDEVPRDCAADCIVITRDSRHFGKILHDLTPLALTLQPVPRIQQRVDEQVARLRAARYSIGIHFRHGNGEKKVIAPDPRWFRNRINGKLKQRGLQPDEVAVYVATDCKGTLDYFKRYYPLVVDLDKPYRANGEGALHIDRQDLSDEQKIAMADEALIDMYLLSKCNWFVGSRGYFSLFVRILRGAEDNPIYAGTRVFDSYRFTSTYYPIERDPLLAPLMRSARQRMDGLFVHLTPEGRHVHYYDEPLHLVSADKQSLTSAESLALRQAIAARRTY
jgi:hypothetical protein